MAVWACPLSQVHPRGNQRCWCRSHPPQPMAIRLFGSLEIELTYPSSLLIWTKPMRTLIFSLTASCLAITPSMASNTYDGPGIEVTMVGSLPSMQISRIDSLAERSITFTSEETAALKISPITLSAVFDRRILDSSYFRNDAYFQTASISVSVQQVQGVAPNGIRFSYPSIQIPLLPRVEKRAEYGDVLVDGDSLTLSLQIQPIEIHGGNWLNPSPDWHCTSLSCMVAGRDTYKMVIAVAMTSPVPEPTALSLAAIGLTGLLITRRSMRVASFGQN